MKRFWILALAVSVGLNAGLLYVVVLSKGEEGHRPPPGSGRPPPGAHFEGVLDAHLRRMTESLGLDDQQRTTIAALHQTLLPKIREQHRTKDRLRRELAELYASPSFEPAAFRALVEQLGKAQRELDALVTEAMLGEAAVITTDQRRKYAREMPWANPLPPPHPREGRPR